MSKVPEIPIWFVFGISGAGKSHFCEWLQAAKGMVHLDIDLSPKDGIEVHGLRAEWNAFLEKRKPKELIQTLRARCAQVGSTGVVLSFPGNVVGCIAPDHILSCAGEVTFAFISGDPKLCLSSFLEREKRTLRQLDRGHWERNNNALFSKLEQPVVREYVIDAFAAKGCRKSLDALYAEVLAL